MRGFNYNTDKMRRAGYQKHHLIPIEVYSSPIFERLFAQIRALGFDPRDFSTNGIWLPGTEETAVKSGLPLHRGPHPQYSMLVRESIDAFCDPRSFSHNLNAPGIELAKRISHLQGSLRRALSSVQPGLTRIGHDMDDAYRRLAAEYSQLSNAVMLS